ncbi:MAG: hypothetical protein M3Q29_16880 [Chloroflexota bacterium]|nr:hypothetical protein [Chloroflexota bacterium]
MREQMRARLEELQREWEAGSTQLQEMEMRAAALRETLLRIDGAMTVLREMLHQSEAASANGSEPQETAAKRGV